MKIWMVGILGLTCGCVAITDSFGSVVEPVGLRCEYLENPLGIDAVQPRLSWRIEAGDQRSEIRDQKATPDTRHALPAAFGRPRIRFWWRRARNC
jgi:hypothetical protein